MENVIIERVYSQEFDLNNTCNYPKNDNDTAVSDLDYDTEFRKTNLENYCDIINYPVAWQYTFTNNEIKLLSKLYHDKSNINNDDTLTNIVSRLESMWQIGDWFFRFNSMSAKDGTPAYPITNANQTINKIITSK